MDMVSKKPNLFIVGAPKCGTSFLYKYLSIHPDIFMSHEKEPNFFDKDLHYKSRVSLEEYLSLFKEVTNEKIIGEASPLYLYSSVAANEIFKFNPDAKIVILLRDPVNMMYSLHAENVYQGNECEEDFQKAIELELHRRNGEKIYSQSNPLEVVYYESIASYAEQIKRYLSQFGREKVKVILFDDIVNKPKDTYKDLLVFLEVDLNFQVDFEIVNENKKIKNKWVRELVKRPPVLFRSLFRLLFPSHKARRFIQESIIKFNTSKVKRKPLDKLLAQRLKKEMEGEIEKLGKIINRDLSMWKN